MTNKWALRWGASILALAIVTACGATNDQIPEENRAPTNQEDINNPTDSDLPNEDIHNRDNQTNDNDGYENDNYRNDRWMTP